MKEINVLVAGGAGFIGSHLCKELLNRKFNVFCIDNLVSGNINNILKLQKNSQFKFLKFDLNEPLSQEIYKIKPHIIYNLACPASPKQYLQMPIKTLTTSIYSNENLLKIAAEHNSNYIFTSTSEVYGDPLDHPQKESYNGNVSINSDRACYFEGKRAGEVLINSYAKKYKIKTKILRLFNCYGPQMKPNDGRVVSQFIMNCLQGKQIKIHGSGLQTRSFCYISDTIQALLKAIHLEKNTPVNIGNPEEISVIELAQIIQKMTMTNSHIVHIAALANDPQKRKPDITKAKKILDWEPKIELRVGLKKTIDYFKTIKY